MEDRDNTWAIVLAAGAGSRLSSLTMTPSGRAVPKQFCSLRGGASLLQCALRRAEALVTRERTCTIVAAQHRDWWTHELALLPVSNIIVQPHNRGTGNGILLALLHVLERDPHAQLVLLPSDHHVCAEETLSRALRRATTQLHTSGGGIFLLGIEPRESDPELGYIVPSRRDKLESSFAVERFVEKPPLTKASKLIEHGALWNAFIIVATAQALLVLFEKRFPNIVAQMRCALQSDTNDPGEGAAMKRLYEQLPTIDFSGDVLQGQEARLRVMPVPQCGWSDLGTPRCVAETLSRVANEPSSMSDSSADAACLNLAAQQELLAVFEGAARSERHLRAGPSQN